jgi:ABC-type transport system involved in multi-copper enzyme maturation permease subunit
MEVIKMEQTYDKNLDEDVIAVGKQKKKINMTIVVTGLVILAIGVYITFLITQPWLYILAGAIIFTGLLFVINGINDKDDEFQIKLKK